VTKDPRDLVTTDDLINVKAFEPTRRAAGTAS